MDHNVELLLSSTFTLLQCFASHLNLSISLAPINAIYAIFVLTQVSSRAVKQQSKLFGRATTVE